MNIEKNKNIILKLIEIENLLETIKDKKEIKKLKNQWTKLNNKLEKKEEK